MPDARAPLGLPDRYRSEGLIAHGGMAVVYAAHDTVLDRPVAVKVLAEHLGHDDVARHRFAREARAAAALSAHPSVVTIYDVGEHDGRAFIVMERRDGGTVADRLAAGPVPRALALRWLHDAASAIDAAHDRGIVHRDIKPANLLLDGRDQLAVADFGIASLAYEDQVTQSGQVLGTAAYISPEQASGDGATAASDRYALAAVAFELLTGRRPFRGETFAAQARAHVEDPVPDAPGLPRPAQEALARGMAKDPGARPATAAALVDELERGLAAAPEATEATQVMPAAAPPPPREPASVLRERPAPVAADEGGPSRRLLAVLAAVALALLVLVGALALGAGGGDDGDRRADATRTPTATKTPRRKRTPTPTPTATATATATPTATATATPTAAATRTSGGSPSALNAAGYDRIKAGDYAGAVAPLRQAVDACGGSTELDPCGYALFNLGQALNRSGSPAEAIPFLQRRLDGFSYARGTVQQELAAACKAAGQACGGGEAGPGSAEGPGKGGPGKAKPGKGPKD